MWPRKAKEEKKNKNQTKEKEIGQRQIKKIKKKTTKKDERTCFCLSRILWKRVKKRKHWFKNIHTQTVAVEKNRDDIATY